MRGQRLRSAAFVPLVLLSVGACEAIFPNSAGFRQLRYYATGDVRPGTVDYSVLFCPDGRVDMIMAEYAVHGTYEVNGSQVVVRTRYNEVHFQLSADRDTLIPVAGGVSLRRNRGYEEDDPTCADGAQVNRTP